MTYNRNQVDYHRGMHPYPASHSANCICASCLGVYIEDCICEACTTRRIAKNVDHLNERANRMSAINLCDRCEAMCKGSALGTFMIGINVETPKIYKELCPGCIEELYEWLNKTCEPREKAYKEPFHPPTVKEDENTLEDVLDKAVQKALKALPSK